jgi:Na+/H+ antiporter NhaD/arsenite permease-like protein
LSEGNIKAGRVFACAGAFLAAMLVSSGACASQAAPIDGTKLSLLWGLPFVGVLGSIALIPTAMPHFWHRHYTAVSLFWALAFLVPFAAVFGFGAAFHEFAHVLLLEYIPFIALITALFVIAGGIYVGGSFRGTPLMNSAIMLVGMILASFAGTTGAAMITIRPLMRANREREHKVHTVIFFIFLVCNIGGALTPLGDPPLFLGYLQGVDFFWPLKFLWRPTLLVAGIVLVSYFVLDSVYYYRRENLEEIPPEKHQALSIHGLVNVPLLLLVILAVMLSGLDGYGTVEIFGTEVSRASLARDFALVLLAVASLVLTPHTSRKHNEFNWDPVLEVATLFAAIFITIVPAIAFLKAGPQGSLAPLFSLLDGTGTPNNIAYFWLTGLLSSFLDNAPTYLVFFNAAGGDATTLMGPMAQTLAAISAGAVFMGANTYIGNAPNFMVKAIASHLGVRMPSFFHFMAWSMVFLMPPFVLVTLLFF